MICWHHDGKQRYALPIIKYEEFMELEDILMRYIFVHGLGQSSSSWEKTISCMDDKTQISNPDLFDLLQDKEPTYNNLYTAFSKYIEEYFK